MARKRLDRPRATRPPAPSPAARPPRRLGLAAGVTARAIVGALALILFSNRLVDRSGQIDLSPQAHGALLNEADRLGAANVPDQVPAALAPQGHTAIQLAFVDVFHTVLLISAGLAWIGALLAALISKPASSKP